MYGFGLEETGNYAAAEKTAKLVSNTNVHYMYLSYSSDRFPKSVVGTGVPTTGVPTAWEGEKG